MDPSGSSSVVTLPGGRHGSFLTWADLRVGTELFLYGKVYHISSCMPATRRWYEAKDEELGGTGEYVQVEDEPTPTDAFTASNAEELVRYLFAPPCQNC